MGKLSCAVSEKAGPPLRVHLETSELDFGHALQGTIVLQPAQELCKPQLVFNVGFRLCVSSPNALGLTSQVCRQSGRLASFCVDLDETLEPGYTYSCPFSARLPSSVEVLAGNAKWGGETCARAHFVAPPSLNSSWGHARVTWLLEVRTNDLRAAVPFQFIPHSYAPGVSADASGCTPDALCTLGVQHEYQACAKGKTLCARAHLCDCGKVRVAVDMECCSIPEAIECEARVTKYVLASSTPLTHLDGGCAKTVHCGVVSLERQAGSADAAAHACSLTRATLVGALEVPRSSLTEPTHLARFTGVHYTLWLRVNGIKLEVPLVVLGPRCTLHES